MAVDGNVSATNNAGVAGSGAVSVCRTLGTAKGDFVVPEDFDAPLPDEVLEEFGA